MIGRVLQGATKPGRPGRSGHVPFSVVSNANEDSSRALTQVQHRAVSELLRVSPVADDLARRFQDAGFTLALVGGSVRDALLGRLGNDLDFTTDARPEAVLKIVRPWADSVWEVGIAFGTVGAQKDGYQIEVTTYRSEAYDRTSRKPEVSYGDSIEEDLVRRDFTVNAMAVALPQKDFVDPHGGLEDLARRVLRTPERRRNPSPTIRCACCVLLASPRSWTSTSPPTWSRR